MQLGRYATGCASREILTGSLSRINVQTDVRCARRHSLFNVERSPFPRALFSHAAKWRPETVAAVVPGTSLLSRRGATLFRKAAEILSRTGNRGRARVSVARNARSYFKPDSHVTSSSTSMHTTHRLNCFFLPVISTLWFCTLYRQLSASLHSYFTRWKTYATTATSCR